MRNNNASGLFPVVADADGWETRWETGRKPDIAGKFRVLFPMFPIIPYEI
jgi:hypothetical protein